MRHFKKTMKNLLFLFEVSTVRDADSPDLGPLVRTVRPFTYFDNHPPKQYYIWAKDWFPVSRLVKEEFREQIYEIKPMCWCLFNSKESMEMVKNIKNATEQLALSIIEEKIEKTGLFNIKDHERRAYPEHDPNRYASPTN